VVTAGLKAIYQGECRRKCTGSPEHFYDQWNPRIGESWRANWDNI